jgi:hypothetical protein
VFFKGHSFVFPQKCSQQLESEESYFEIGFPECFANFIGMETCTASSSHGGEDEHLYQKRNRPVDSCEGSRERRHLRFSSPFLVCSVALSLLFLPHRQTTGLIVTNPAIRISIPTQLPAFRSRPSSLNARKGFISASRTNNVNMQATASKDTDSIQTFFPAANRIIAIGDLHGDAKALRACLDMAGLVDQDGNWAGGDTHLVQV